MLFIKKVQKCIKRLFIFIEGKTSAQVVNLKSSKPAIGNALISYIIAPFLIKHENALPKSHSNQWECLQIVKTFLELGYDVDVINWNNYTFLPKIEYDIFIDIHCNMERIAPLLKKSCKKILHITGAHWIFQNQAEYSRLLQLQQRRHVTLYPRRTVPPSLGIEVADCATILGNEFTIGTFSYSQKKLYKIPVSTCMLYEFNEKKDFERCKKNYIWLGSSGLVHKGLDIVLEAFSEMPESKLTVFGPIKTEKDFEVAFFQELYKTPNIQTVGWVEIDDPRFLEHVNNSIGFIFPSCSEGQAGCVISCLHLGLIPIVSVQSGVDIQDFGIGLKNNSKDEIKHAVSMLSLSSGEQLKKMARDAWQYARSNHTRETFAKEYKKAIASILT